MGEGGGGFLIQPARFPGRAPIDAYGGGGFRFADMSHRGSILALPSGIEAWAVRSPEEIDEAAVARLVAEAPGIEVLLMGTGTGLVPLKREVRRTDVAVLGANEEFAAECEAAGHTVRRLGSRLVIEIEGETKLPMILKRALELGLFGGVQALEFIRFDARRFGFRRRRRFWRQQAHLSLQCDEVFFGAVGRFHFAELVR